MQCIVITPVCLSVCVYAGLLPRQLKIACIDPDQTGLVSKGSDHLQLIKFWLSRTPEMASAVGRKILAPPYYSQRAVFPSPLSTFFLTKDVDLDIVCAVCVVAVWCSGNALVLINAVALHRALLVLGWVTYCLWAGKLSHYITSHPGQLSLAIPLWVGAMSTSDGYGHRQGRKRRVLRSSSPCD